jgi:hypothetical protein
MLDPNDQYDYSDASIDLTDAVCVLREAFSHSAQTRPLTPAQIAIATALRISTAPHIRAERFRTLAPQSFASLIHRFSVTETGDKDGSCYIPGTLIDDARPARGSNRNVRNIRELTAMVFDCDAGQCVVQACQNIAGSGHAAIVHQSYSDGKSTTTLDGRDGLINKALESGFAQPDIEFFQHHLASLGKLTPDMAATIRAVKDTGTAFEIEHAPLLRFRVILPLSEPFCLIVPDASHADRARLWAEYYCAVGERLGLSFDRACTDVARAFYFPRRPQGAGVAAPVVIKGGLLDLKAVPLSARPKSTRTGRISQKQGLEVELEGIKLDLVRWIAAGGRRFELASALEAYDLEHHTHSKGGAGLNAECPFEEEHGKIDNRFWCLDASEHDHSVFQARCPHAACSERNQDKLLFLRGLIEAGRIPLEALQNESLYALHEGESFAPIAALLGIAVEPSRSRAAQTSSVAGSYDQSDETLRLGADFKVQGDWIGKIKISGDREYFSPICRKFEVVGRTHSEQGKEWGLLVRFQNPAGQIVELELKSEELHSASPALRSRVAGAGLTIIPTASRQFDDLIATLDTEHHISVVSRPGWHDAVFVAPTGVIVGADDRSIRLKDEAGTEDRCISGDLAAWVQATHELACANDHWALGLAGAFAGPVVQLCGMDSCGINLSGPTSFGKSTSQEIAASAWANPRARKGVMHTMRATGNAIENLAVRSTGTVLCLDELRHANPKEIGSIVMTLAGGSAKSRQSRSSGLRGASSWETFYILSSERPLRDIIESSGDAYLGGFTVRLPDVSVADGKRCEQSWVRAKCNALRANYGAAGPLFVSGLITAGFAQDPGPVRDRFGEICIRLTREAGSSEPAIARAAKVFAVLAVSVKLASEVGPLQAATAEVVVAAIDRAWLSFAASTSANAIDPVSEAITGLTNAYASRKDLDIIPIEGSRKFREAVGWYEEGLVYIRRDKLVALSNAKVGVEAIIKRLKEQEALMTPRGDDRLYHRYLKGVGKVEVYKLDADVLELDTTRPPDPADED